MISPVLHTDRLVMTPISAAQEAAFVAFFAASDVAQGAYRRCDAAEARAKVAAWVAAWRKGFGLWALEADGVLIGAAGLAWPDDFPSHELTWLLFPEHRGKGYAEEASRAAIAWAYDILGWDPVETYIRDENAPARKLAARLGGVVTRRETFPDGVARDIFALPHPGGPAPSFPAPSFPAPTFPCRIETDRLVLRRPIASDRHAFIASGTGPRSAFVGGPYSTRDASKNFFTLIGQWQVRGYGRYVMTRRDDGRPIGHCGPIHVADDDAVEMSWTIWDDRDEGHGFATEASAAVRDVWLSLDGAPPMIAFVDHENRKSIAVATRLGGVLDPDHPKPDWSDKAHVYRYERGAA